MKADSLAHWPGIPLWFGLGLSWIAVTASLF